MDCLIYIAVLAVILSVAFSAFYKCLDFSKDLNRNASDIVRTLQAGERWRADIRSATAPPKIVTEDGFSALEIPHSSGTVVYLFFDRAVWRKADLLAPMHKVLPEVNVSRMEKKSRQRVACWSWSVELRSRKQFVRVPPMFDFLAVAPVDSAP